MTAGGLARASALAATSGSLPVAQALSVPCGGATPKGVEIIVTRANDALYADVAPGLMESWGISDGTTTLCAASMSEHNVAANVHDTGHQGSSSGKIIRILDTATEAVIAEADFVSFAADVVNISWTTLPGTDYVLLVRVLYGDDCEAGVVTVVSSTTLNGTVDATLSFRPIGSLWGGRQNGFGNAGSANARIQRGFCAWDEAGNVVGQFGGTFGSSDRSATTACALVAGEGDIGFRLGVSAAGVSQAATIRVTQGLANGFTVKTVGPGLPATPNALVMGVLAFRFGSRRCWAGRVEVDVTTTDEQFFDPASWRVGAMWMLSTSLDYTPGDPYTSVYAKVSSSWSYGCTGIGNGTDGECATHAEKTNAATSATFSRVAPFLVSLLDPDGNPDWDCDVRFEDDSGFTLIPASTVSGHRLTNVLILESAIGSQLKAVTETEELEDAVHRARGAAVTEIDEIEDAALGARGAAASESEELEDSARAARGAAATEVEELVDAALLSRGAEATEVIELLDDVLAARGVDVGELEELADETLYARGAELTELEEISDEAVYVLGNADNSALALVIWEYLIGPASAGRTLETILSMFLRRGETVENLDGTKTVTIFDADDTTPLTVVDVNEDGVERDLVTSPTSLPPTGSPAQLAIALAVWSHPIFDGIAAGVVLNAVLAIFLRDADVVENIDGSRTVTVYDIAGVTPVYQLLISADGLDRTRIL